MSRRLMLLGMLITPALAWGRSPNGALEGMDLFAQASTSLWKWLSSLSINLEAFVAKEKRAQLAEALRKLNHALYEVESSKVLLISQIRRSSDTEGEKTETRRVAMHIIATVGNLRSAVREVAVSLRERAQEGGVQCESLLSVATGENKLWLYDIANDRRAMFAKAELLERAEAAVKALRAASLEVAKLTVKLAEG